jgi:hypothetical protein
VLEAQAKQLNDEARHLRSLKQCIQVRQTASAPEKNSQCAAHSELLGGAYDSEVITLHRPADSIPRPVSAQAPPAKQTNSHTIESCPQRAAFLSPSLSLTSTL